MYPLISSQDKITKKNVGQNLSGYSYYQRTNSRILRCTLKFNLYRCCRIFTTIFHIGLLIVPLGMLLFFISNFSRSRRYYFKCSHFSVRRNSTSENGTITIARMAKNKVVEPRIWFRRRL